MGYLVILQCHMSMQCRFYRAVHCNVMRQLKTEALMGLKTDDSALKQNMFT